MAVDRQSSADLTKITFRMEKLTVLLVSKWCFGK